MKYTKLSILFAVGLITGALWHSAWLFPFPQLSALRANLPKHQPALRYTGQCPVVNEAKLNEIRDIFAHTQIDNLFWGDSVVEGMHDSRLFGASNFVEVAHSGQIVFCAMNEIPFIKKMKPKRLLIYIGGNDADGQSWYGPEDAASYYCKMLDDFISSDIEPIVHLIHGASADRNQHYVKTYNSIIQDFCESRGILVIQPLDELRFNNSRTAVDSPYSYDGEHLKPEGYRLWISHIRKHLSDF